MERRSYRGLFRVSTTFVFFLSSIIAVHYHLHQCRLIDRALLSAVSMKPHGQLEANQLMPTRVHREKWASITKSRISYSRLRTTALGLSPTLQVPPICPSSRALRLSLSLVYFKTQKRPFAETRIVKKKIVDPRYRPPRNHWTTLFLSSIWNLDHIEPACRGRGIRT